MMEAIGAVDQTAALSKPYSGPYDAIENDDVLCCRDVFSAGASHYGVADLELLAQETHKFESRYLDQLIGPYPAEKQVYVDRSPIHALDKFTAPTAFFQVSWRVQLCTECAMHYGKIKLKRSHHHRHACSKRPALLIHHFLGAEGDLQTLDSCRLSESGR